VSQVKNYSVLMIDLKNSRSYSIQDRNNLQNSILNSIKILNKAFKNSIKKEVEFSAGDEIQGLFTSPHSAYLYYRLFSIIIFPIEIHSGIGYGTWDIVMDNESSTAQDGTVYHNARKAIDEAKKSLEYSVLFYSSNKNDLIVNSLINSCNLLAFKQSKYQNNAQIEKESFYITEGKKRGLSTQFSKLLGVSRQSVEKAIKTGNIYDLRNLTIAILKAMDNTQGESL